MDPSDPRYEAERPLIKRQLHPRQGGKTVEIRSYLRGHREGAMLFGWRVISEYIGVSKQTAYTWYKRYQFPVVRLVGRRVFTTRTAIDRWVERMSLQERKILKELGLGIGDEGAKRNKVRAKEARPWVTATKD